MHSKETVSIFSLMYEPNQIKNFKNFKKFRELTPYTPRLDRALFENLIYPLIKFNILRVKFDPIPL